MPKPLDERKPENHSRAWVKLFVAFSASAILLAVFLVMAIRYPTAGKWISDGVQAEFADPRAPDVKTVEQLPPRNLVHAAKTK